jgi:prepilin-type processing-associated H-X9-DG protein
MNAAVIGRCRLSRPGNKRAGLLTAGFSLVELLVAIGIITLVIAILLPTLHAAREQAKMIVCRNNLRQIGLAATAYANEHRGFYPCGPLFYAGYYLVDLTEFSASGLREYGLQRQQFYCPFLLDHSVDSMDRMWNLDASYLYYHITGYYFLFGRGWNNLPVINPPKYWKFKVTDIRHEPDDTELVTDVTMCYTDSWPASRYYDIYDPYTGSGTDITLSTAHLKDKVPLGGNILFMDGHVDWRSYAGMSNRWPSSGFAIWF